MYRVRFVKPDQHYLRIKPEIDRAILGCLERGELVCRQELADFEAHLAAFAGARFAVGVNSGYHALALSLLAAGIGPGDEVVTVAHTFVATISAVVHCGAKPVLVDVHPDYTMDPDALERAITPRTRAVIPVHLNGRLCDMGRIMSIAEARRLIVIEDAAQAIGARPAGTFGRAGCFSFYPLKMLGAFGDGGAVVTNDPELAEAVRRLRFNGEDRSTGEYHHHGFTALLDNVQAAALDVKLRHLPEWIEHRRRIAELYRRELPSEVALPHFDGRGYDDAFQNYVIRARRRDALREHLERRGVETLVHWPKPIWEHRALNLGAYRLPETEAMCREVLSLPMSAETTPEEVGIVGEAVREFFERKP